MPHHFYLAEAVQISKTHHIFFSLTVLYILRKWVMIAHVRSTKHKHPRATFVIAFLLLFAAPFPFIRQMVGFGLSSILWLKKCLESRCRRRVLINAIKMLKATE